MNCARRNLEIRTLEKSKKSSIWDLMSKFFTSISLHFIYGYFNVERGKICENFRVFTIIITLAVAVRNVIFYDQPAAAAVNEINQLIILNLRRDSLTMTMMMKLDNFHFYQFIILIVLRVEMEISHQIEKMRTYRNKFCHNENIDNSFHVMAFASTPFCVVVWIKMSKREDFSLFSLHLQLLLQFFLGAHL